MNKQKYQLNELVYVFRQVSPEELQEGTGRVRRAEINRGGVIQYTILVTHADGRQEEWQANSASLANTAEELQTKIKTYRQFLSEQKAQYEKLFGKPEFTEQELENGK